MGSAPAGYLMGMSHVIRAQGEYNELTSRAYINYEEARSNTSGSEEVSNQAAYWANRKK